MESTSQTNQKVAFEPLFDLFFAPLSLYHIVAEFGCPHVFGFVEVGRYEPGLILDFRRTVCVTVERVDGERFGALGNLAVTLGRNEKNGLGGGKETYAPLARRLVVDIVVVCSASLLRAG